MKMVGNYVPYVQTTFISNDLDSLALPVLAHSGFCFWLHSISDEGHYPK